MRLEPPADGLRVVLYDRTCGGPTWWRPGLSDAWWVGTRLYRALGRVHVHRGVASWGEALGWLATFAQDRPLARVEYWGHGKWGRALADREDLDERALLREAPHRPLLAAIARRFREDGLWWFRTCETFGGAAGHRFARSWADTLGCRVAAHTFVIGAVQSGLHSLRPGETPTWSDTEGIAEGTAQDPARAHTSSFRAPHTITCLHDTVPEGW